MELTELFVAQGNSWDDRSVRIQLDRFGWEVDGDEFTCPRHAREEEGQDEYEIRRS